MREHYRGRSVLVTGGLGFIGSNLAIALVECGARVTLVDAMLPGFGARRFNVEPVEDRVRISFADLRDAAALREVVRDQELVFSLAGQMSHARSMRDPLLDLEINCRAHLTLLECCRELTPAATVVLASTRQVYGRPQRLPVDEDHPSRPVDVNGINKLAAESYYELYHRVYGLRTARLRLTNTYGPRMDLGHPDKGVVGVLLRKALDGQTLPLFGGGTQRRDFNYVDDVVDALLRAGASPAVVGQVFNLGHPRPRSLLDFVSTLQRYLDCRWERVPFPEEQQVIDIGDYAGDFSRFQAATGWSPAIDLDEGLERTVAFFRRFAKPYLLGA